MAWEGITVSTLKVWGRNTDSEIKTWVRIADSMIKAYDRIANPWIGGWLRIVDSTVVVWEEVFNQEMVQEVDPSIMIWFKRVDDFFWDSKGEPLSAMSWVDDLRQLYEGWQWKDNKTWTTAIGRQLLDRRARKCKMRQPPSYLEMRLRIPTVGLMT